MAAGFVKFDLEAPDIWTTAGPEVDETSAFVRAGRRRVPRRSSTSSTRTSRPATHGSPTSLDDNAWARLVDTTKRTLDVARRHGLRPVFHPHAKTHVEYEAQIERLLEDIDDLELCFDFGHHAYCGGDAVPFFGRHRDRIPYLHLKSVDGDIRDRVAREGLSFSDAVAQGVFVEPSLGVVDYVALRDLIIESGYSGLRHRRAGHVSGRPGQAVPDREAHLRLPARSRPQLMSTRRCGRSRARPSSPGIGGPRPS